jgi:hypothetical protein
MFEVFAPCLLLSPWGCRGGGWGVLLCWGSSAVLGPLGRVVCGGAPWVCVSRGFPGGGVRCGVLLSFWGGGLWGVAGGDVMYLRTVPISMSQHAFCWIGPVWGFRAKIVAACSASYQLLLRGLLASRYLYVMLDIG